MLPRQSQSHGCREVALSEEAWYVDTRHHSPAHGLRSMIGATSTQAHLGHVGETAGLLCQFRLTVSEVVTELRCETDDPWLAVGDSVPTTHSVVSIIVSVGFCILLTCNLTVIFDSDLLLRTFMSFIGWFTCITLFFSRNLCVCVYLLYICSAIVISYTDSFTLVGAEHSNVYLPFSC